MATYGWGTDCSVDESLFKEGHRFDFYQAVRLLELLRPARVPVGEGSDPALESTRFKSRVSLDFPAGEVDEVRAIRHSDQPEMVVNFLGLAGALGPLPNTFTELIVDRVHKKDTAMRDFLDIFNHRLVSLMYRVRKIHRLSVDVRRPEERPFARYLYSFVGLGTKGLRDRMRVSDRALLHYSGILSMKPRSAVGLELMLSDYFRERIKVKALTGHWHRLEADQLTILGVRGQNRRLGQETVIGSRVWDQQGSFTLEVGPIRIKEFRDFLPTGKRYGPLSELTRFYIGTELDFTVLLKLRGSDVSESRLGGENGPRLGWTSWLKTRPYKAEMAQVLLRPGHGS